jgi:hypothetical protein
MPQELLSAELFFVGPKGTGAPYINEEWYRNKRKPNIISNLK